MISTLVLTIGVLFGIFRITIMKGGNMKKKKSTVNRNILVASICIGAVSLCGLVFGLFSLSNVDLVYQSDIITCDDKDYSSYIKYDTVSTPGNSEINAQIDTLKRAMDNARNVGDSVAFGQLYEKYTDLLKTQSQTSTTNTSYDYSEVEKAKKKCYSLATSQKESNKLRSIVISTVGLVLLVLATAVAIYNWVKTSKSTANRKR